MRDGAVPHDTRQELLGDIGDVIKHIWENHAREMFGKQMNVNICITSCFMGLRFVAAQTPSFVEGIKNTKPQKLKYLDSPPLNVDNLVRVLSEALAAGGAFPYLLLNNGLMRGYPDYLPELIGLLSSDIPGEMVAQMFHTQIEMKASVTFREGMIIEYIKELCEIVST